MNENKFAPEVDELSEEALEKVAGGESVYTFLEEDDLGPCLPVFNVSSQTIAEAKGKSR